MGVVRADRQLQLGRGASAVSGAAFPVVASSDIWLFTWQRQLAISVSGLFTVGFSGSWASDSDLAFPANFGCHYTFGKICQASGLATCRNIFSCANFGVEAIRKLSLGNNLLLCYFSAEP